MLSSAVKSVGLDEMISRLYTLCVIFIANEIKIASLGGIEAIIKAMSTHKDNSVVQENGCRALWNLAANDGICIFVFHLLFCPLL